MSTRRLERLGLDAFLLERLGSLGICTAKDLLETCPLVLMIHLDLSKRQLDRLIMKVSEAIVGAKCATALELLSLRKRTVRHMKTGIPLLDIHMRGGLNVGCISEVCGPPGIGKTQFCIGMCVEAIEAGRLGQPGIGKSFGVVYLDTELKFDATRLVEIAEERYPATYSNKFSDDADSKIEMLLNAVKVKRPSSCRELLEEIGNLENLVIAEGISLIVVDSIAALARKEALNESDKEQFVVRQAAVLKKLAEFCNCVVLATNQVTPEDARDAPKQRYSSGKRKASELEDSGSGDDNDDKAVYVSNKGGGDALGDRIADNAGGYRPALGATWHHCVSARLVMRTIPGSMGSSSAQGLAGSSAAGGGGGISGTQESGEDADADFGGAGTMGKGAYGVPSGFVGGDTGRRILTLTKSPIAGTIEIPYTVGLTGICEINC